MRRVAVVGAGIAGLSAARELVSRCGSGGEWSVTVFERTARLGGKLRTSPFAGRPAVDEGADAFLARVPHAVGLARSVGVDDLVTPHTSRAAICHDRLRRMPEGLMLGVPTGVLGLARSRLLSPLGLARAAADLVLPRFDAGDSIGALVRHRLGDETHDRLVDALIGSIYGADTDRYSLEMVPQLAAVAGGRSLVVTARRLRRRTGASRGPVFLAPRQGLESLATAVGSAIERAGGDVLLTSPATSVERDGPGWRVDDEVFDAVVLAAPARAASGLIAGAAPGLARLLAAMETAGVAIVTVAVPELPVRLGGLSGYLVPKSRQTLVTATSFGSQKWAHWRGDGDDVLRISAGRDGLGVPDDDTVLVGLCIAQTGRHLGIDLSPSAVRVSRWPDAFPQYRPHHRRWLDAVDDATPSGLVLAGASYRGVGIPACVADGVRAARLVTRHLDPR